MPTQRNIYVAVVDDDVSVCQALVRFLRESGIQAITYASAEEFLDDHKRPAFDCLAVDVELADLSGIDLQQRLADGGCSLPTIVITASDDPERAVYFTGSFKTTEGQPLVLRWAKALKNIADKMSVTIFDDELIVGRASTWFGRY